jgi:membrane-bound metal-dependent hydrolase YbcI (DUF457 family)
MKFPEHIAMSYLLAQLGVQQEYGLVGTALVVAAGNLPDLDVATLLVSRRFYRDYHRVVGHGILITLVGPLLLALLGAGLLGWNALTPLWCWLQLALLIHLFVDVCFYRWPVQLLWPFSTRGWGFGLVAWNDLIPTVTLYAGVVLTLLWPERALAIAAVSLSVVAYYLAWRAFQPRPEDGWRGWLAGGWAPRSPRFFRWLTGDFVT